MEWRTPIYKDKVLILVEGKSDKCFYYKFFNSETSEIRNSQGCRKLKEIHERLLCCHSIKNITIRDSDFERLNGTLLSINGFFYTDAHDYEMMCLRDEQTRKELIENLVTINYSEEVFENIFEELKCISYFKWYNYTKHLSYNFDSFSVTSFEKDQLNDFDFIHGEIHPKSRKAKVVTKTILNKFKTDHNTCDPYELTCGHDFIKRLCFYLKKEHRIQKKENDIKDIMRPCFRMDSFKRTELYHSICAWSNKYSLNILRS